jgi:hypothetical protein
MVSIASGILKMKFIFSGERGQWEVKHLTAKFAKNRREEREANLLIPLRVLPAAKARDRWRQEPATLERPTVWNLNPAYARKNLEST